MKFLLLAFLLIAGPAGAQPVAGEWFAPEQEAEKAKEVPSASSSRELDAEVRAALRDPYRYFRGGKHNTLLETLNNNMTIYASVARLDSLEKVLALTAHRRNVILTFI